MQMKHTADHMYNFPFISLDVLHDIMQVYTRFKLAGISRPILYLDSFKTMKQPGSLFFISNRFHSLIIALLYMRRLVIFM